MFIVHKYYDISIVLVLNIIFYYILIIYNIKCFFYIFGLLAHVKLLVIQ